MTRKPEKKFYGVKSLAQRWDVSERTVRRVIKAGDLPVHWIGGQMRVSDPDREAYERRVRH